MTKQRTYLAGEIASLTGAKKRVLLMWAQAGALEALPDTDRCGSGVHRRFSWAEVEIAAVLQALAAFRLPIGEMVRIAEGFRLQLLLLDDPQLGPLDDKFPLPDAPKEHFERLKRARAGEPGILLTIVPNTGELEPARMRPAWQDWEFVAFLCTLDSLPPRCHQMLIVDLGLCWRGLKT